ncbi:hypothetical protein Cgig2_001273 [Carnegiea gigantea]|uniref:Uncharacterized protein n=1 Tax=Carnegiea gigantea TaxID=171969 RepID=A0A9Q1GVY9_9CARY|nr:hypothetical protein Cgig2_001273 [Carnegiea gigantea]
MGECLRSSDGDEVDGEGKARNSKCDLVKECMAKYVDNKRVKLMREKGSMKPNVFRHYIKVMKKLCQASGGEEQLGVWMQLFTWMIHNKRRIPRIASWDKIDHEGRYDAFKLFADIKESEYMPQCASVDESVKNWFYINVMVELMEKLKQFQANSAWGERDECAYASAEQLNDTNFTANVDMSQGRRVYDGVEVVESADRVEELLHEGENPKSSPSTHMDVARPNVDKDSTVEDMPNPGG